MVEHLVQVCKHPALKSAPYNVAIFSLADVYNVPVVFALLFRRWLFWCRCHNLIPPPSLLNSEPLNGFGLGSGAVALQTALKDMKVDGIIGGHGNIGTMSELSKIVALGK